MLMKSWPFVFLLVCLSCKNDKKPAQLSAIEIIQKSIEVSGGDLFSSSVIGFKFRDHFYKAKRNYGSFILTRITTDENQDSIFDVLDNSGFKRIINKAPVQVIDSIAKKYAASVNSVHYFSVLPYGLDSPAVNHKLLGVESIKDENYYKIEVTFDKKGGGEDYEDVFIYWVNKNTFKIDYLAYSYNEEDGVGVRFRQAYNERYINGLRFVDYNNYKPKTMPIDLMDLGSAFKNNQLELLSKIELKNISVNLIQRQ
jgi:hypothetical protein